MRLNRYIDALETVQIKNINWYKEVLARILVQEHKETGDEAWQLPPRALRKLRARPKSVTLTLPAQEIPALLSSTSTVTKTSTRHELKLMSTLLKAGGADITSISMRISTIHRQRRSTVHKNADLMRAKIKSHIKEEKEKFIVLHWDGKISQYLSGATEDRLAIAISAPNSIPGQFLASPVIAEGTGLTMSNCVFDIASDYGILFQVQAMVFDTTARNTGKHKGNVTLFEKTILTKIGYNLH